VLQTRPLEAGRARFSATSDRGAIYSPQHLTGQMIQEVESIDLARRAELAQFVRATIQLPGALAEGAFQIAQVAGELTFAIGEDLSRDAIRVGHQAGQYASELGAEAIKHTPAVASEIVANCLHAPLVDQVAIAATVGIGTGLAWRRRRRRQAEGAGQLVGAISHSDGVSALR
jgi:hypothetical protein